jgi:hypothetical protein
LILYFNSDSTPRFIAITASQTTRTAAFSGIHGVVA